jgi:endonuclease YncB( thermonuclease family)
LAVACAIGLVVLGCAPERPLRTATTQPPTPSAREARVNRTLTGAVLRVADGDTLTLRARSGDNITVRLSDIDTPEIYTRPTPTGMIVRRTAA